MSDTITNDNLKQEISYNVAADGLINKAHNIKQSQYRNYVLKNAIRDCVKSFDSGDLLQSERNCIEKSFLNNLENYYLDYMK